jgi:hypothetical protein
MENKERVKCMCLCHEEGVVMDHITACCNNGYEFEEKEVPRWMPYKDYLFHQGYMDLLLRYYRSGRIPQEEIDKLNKQIEEKLKSTKNEE